jgi:hypothetical protein
MTVGVGAQSPSLLQLLPAAQVDCALPSAPTVSLSEQRPLSTTESVAT